MTPLAILLALLVGYAAGLTEGAHQERRRIAKLLTALTPKGDE